MSARTPITIVSGPLGSGKTTLLRHLLASTTRRLAILMNEFGEIAIDSRIIQGANVLMAELPGGCVCCSLMGEFEAAVNEIIAQAHPDQIVVETTGVAEPGALAFDIQENLPQVRLDGTIAVLDADGLLRFPSLGHTTRLQIEAADLLLLNKIDQVDAAQLPSLESKLRPFNPDAPILRSVRGQVDLELLFGLSPDKRLPPPAHLHQPDFESFSYSSQAVFDPHCFEAFAESLHPAAYRAKGFVRFPDGPRLFNFVNGRWEIEPFETEPTQLVFIGHDLHRHRAAILERLEACRA